MADQTSFSDQAAAGSDNQSCQGGDQAGFNADPKLTIELVPKTCWFTNVRDTVTEKTWKELCKKVDEAAGGNCEICGSDNDGKILECHEVWDYNDETKEQTLVVLIGLCQTCHDVKHYSGRAVRFNRTASADAKLCEVNEWSEEDIENHIKNQQTVFAERSDHHWDLDLSKLEEYGAIRVRKGRSLNLSAEERKEFWEAAMKKQGLM